MDCVSCSMIIWFNGEAYCDYFDFGFMPCKDVTDCPEDREPEDDYDYDLDEDCE